jgi:hypothetical protein
MGRCRDCKHWGVAGTFTLPGGRAFSSDEPIFSQDGVKTCLRLDDWLDHSGEEAGRLGAPPDFGCVLFEPALRGMFFEELPEPKQQRPVVDTLYGYPRRRCTPALAVVGCKRDPSHTEPIRVETAEDWRRVMHSEPPDWFIAPAPTSVVIVPVRPEALAAQEAAFDEDAARVRSGFPVPCVRCGNDATLLNAFQNKAGHIFCGHNCYLAGGET